MKRTKRFFMLLLIVAALCALPVLASEIAAVYVGVLEVKELPESWNPLEESAESQRTVLELTAEPLYRVDETGAVIPVQAAGMPEDVTAEFAGAFGIPKNAVRGYAFALSIREGASWEDGKAVSPEDWYATVEGLLEADRFPLEIAGYRSFRQGETKPVAQVISLKEAGFASVAEAEQAGYTDFYMDLDGFWGLDVGWMRITDRTPLRDAAMPSGCEEMYLTPEYLYRHYLGDTGSQKVFQSRFVGIPAGEAEKLTMADVGLVAQENRLVLILENRTAPAYVAAALAEQVCARTGGTADRFLSCGPYRITEVAANEMTLEPNPHWTGAPTEFQIVRIRTAG